MANIIVYSKNFCPYCDRAKNLLNRKGAKFEERNIDGNAEELKKLVEKTGLKTLPQIFINDNLIGGFDDMNALDKLGKLDALLK
ncbi:MAG: glutaredoxin 3 [Bdellovibrionota bacterium]